MRILLATAVAIVPLMVASGAMAEVVISTTRTTPITTSNATGTGPDSIRIGTGGVLAVNSGAAATIDSNHNFTIDTDGKLAMANAADGATGILVSPGVTSTLTINGSLSVTDSVDAPVDSDGDGDIDGPWAMGTGRYGVRLAAGAPVTGDILIGVSGAIVVEGNNSVGILIESGLIGKLLNRGAIHVTGDNSIGVSATGDITGSVTLLGQVSGRGANATAVSLAGDLDGRLTLQGDISASGYFYTTRPLDSFIAHLEPTDMLQGGPAVVVAGDVTGGIVVDRQESTGAINSFGAAPAIVVGSATRSITVGVLGADTATTFNNYGFINRGTITGQGVYDGIAATGVVFGGNAGQAVMIDGGVRNEGTLSALAFKADATALRFGVGASTPKIINTGTITAAVSTDLSSKVAAVRIDSGASVPSLVNDGSILATTGGSTANVTSVLDLSGTLTSITNTRSIQAARLPSADSALNTGSATAIDVSANTTGVNILQNGIASTASASDPDSDGDGVTDSHEPEILGAIKLGSGADTLDVRNGRVTGDIAFGAGADNLSVSGGAVVTGALSDTDGALSIDVANGTLDGRQLTALNLSSLNVGAAGNLIVTLDPAHTNSSGYNVSGVANVATGGGLGVRFASLLDAPGRFNLIQAGTLNAGAINLVNVQGNSPYLYVVEAGVNVPAGQVYVDARRRSAVEAGLIPVEASMYDAVYSALGRDATVRNAFLAQTNRDGFVNLYEQLLPDHSGGPLLSLASGVDAVTRALTGRNASAAPGETSAWVQEINFYADKDKTGTYGFRSKGFGVAGGVEQGTNAGALGVSLAFTSSDLQDPEAEAEEVTTASLLELGLYWRAQGQYWTTWARAAAGYATLSSKRRLVGAGLNLSNTSDWHGYTLAAAAGASYQRDFGRFSLRPEIYAEYFGLSEQAHTESGGGSGFDLSINGRNGHMLSATAAINIGMSLGQNNWVRPELRLGWRQNVSVDSGKTIGRFASGGPDFTLMGADIQGGGPLVGFRLNIGNELGMLSVNADAEMIDKYIRYMLFLRASFRF